MSLKDQILAAQDRTTETVDVPEWGCAVGIRTISGRERDAFEASISDSKGKLTRDNIRARFLVTCLVDPADGSRLFADGEVAALGEKSGNVLVRLFDIAQRVNGLNQQDVDALAKNSESDPSAC